MAIESTTAVTTPVKTVAPVAAKPATATTTAPATTATTTAPAPAKVATATPEVAKKLDVVA